MHYSQTNAYKNGQTNKKIPKRRYFAKANKKDSKLKASLTQLKEDKSTQEYMQILEWWEKFKNSRLNLSVLPSELQSKFIEARQIYKEQNISRINTMKQNVNTAIQRKKEALDALPPRLSLICQIAREPKWKKKFIKYCTKHISFTSPYFKDNTIINPVII